MGVLHREQSLRALCCIWEAVPTKESVCHDRVRPWTGRAGLSPAPGMAPFQRQASGTKGMFFWGDWGGHV